MNNGLQLISLLHQISNSYALALEEVCPDYKLYHLLNMISEAKLSQKEVAKRLGMTEPALSMKIKVLLKTGYITKIKSQKDKRRFLLMVTDQGKELIEKYKNAIEERAIELVNVLEPGDKIQLRMILEKMRY